MLEKPTPEELAEWSGEQNTSANFNVVELQMNKSGTDFVVQEKEDGNWIDKELGETLKVVIIRVRVYLTRYDEETKTTYMSDERNRKEEKFTLTHYRGKGDKEIVGQGSMYELKEMFQIKMAHVLYVADCKTGNLYRLKVRGKSFSNLLEHYKSFDKKAPKDEHTYQFITELGIGQETYDGNEYNATTFKKERQLDEDEQGVVYEEMRKLSEPLLRMDIAKDKTFHSVNKVQVDVTDADIPVIQENGEAVFDSKEPLPEEKKDIGDIPFDENE